jgi:uncharacterized protein YbjT (DUF2867 family)
MVATADIGEFGARLLQQSWTGQRVVELEGPRRITPDQLAACLGRLLGRDVRAEAVPRDSWEARFKAQGMRHPLPRMQMLDGFNAGWLEFESGERGSHKGSTSIEAVLGALIERAA